MFKLAIGNVVEVPVKIALRDGAVEKTYAFRLVAERKMPEEIAEAGEQTISDFLAGVTSDWKGQTLVLDAAGAPAPYSPAALAYMLKVPGVLGAVWGAYARECGAKEKN